MVERCLAKANVAGSNPVFRSNKIYSQKQIATFAVRETQKFLLIFGNEENQQNIKTLTKEKFAVELSFRSGRGFESRLPLHMCTISSAGRAPDS